jgi:ATP-dependent Clp protease ATP-binding subunit ClpA
MQEHTIEYAALVRTLDDGTFLTDALLFPELCLWGDEREEVLAELDRRVCDVITGLPLDEVHSRRIAGVPQTRSTEVSIDPPAGSDAWRGPMRLRFHWVLWRHDERHVLAFVPALDLELLAADEAKLIASLPDEVRLALQRKGSAESLSALIALQRATRLDVAARSVTVKLCTPVELARARVSVASGEPGPADTGAAGGDGDATGTAVDPSLAGVVSDLSKRPLPRAYEVDGVLRRVADCLTRLRPRSVLLVGPSGAGKTAAIWELVRRREELGLGGRPFWETSGARIVSGALGYGMWQETCGRLRKLAHAKGAAVYLGNLFELAHAGRSEWSRQGVAPFLATSIERGELLALAECTPEQFTRIEREEPRVLAAFEVVPIEEPARETGKAILLEHAIERSSAGGPEVDIDVLERVDALHRRYATHSAQPGRPLRFLTSLLLRHADAARITPADVTAAFSRETGLPLAILDDAVPLDVEAARTWFSRRVIGQPEAVEQVVGLLVRVKARLTRPGRPIASLVFTGPTGVGKTEMAKALAEYLFRDARRLVRLDMSEYADFLAVDRLIGGASGDEGLLTSKVREQPFAVVLLDEVEKAHPRFLDLLLQVLGDGRLTDSAGRVASFANAVVILTSNLGSETFGRDVGGFASNSVALGRALEHFRRAVETHVRPELMNRIDRVVPFAPLDEATRTAIVEREMELLQERDGLRARNVRLRVAPEVVSHFVRNGFDARYGARALKRTVARQLTAPLADLLSRRRGKDALEARLEVHDGSIAIDLCCAEDARASKEAEEEARDLASLSTRLRRRTQRFERSALFLEQQNEIARLKRIVAQVENLPPERAHERRAERRQLDLLMEREAESQDLCRRAQTLEDEALLRLHQQAAGRIEGLRSAIEECEADLRRLVLAHLSGRLPGHGSGTYLAVYGEDRSVLFELARAYYDVAWRFAGESAAAVGEVGWFSRQNGVPGHAAHWFVPAESKRVFLNPPQDAFGVALELESELAALRFGPEAGLHVVQSGSGSAECLVETAEFDARDCKPPADIDRRGSFAGAKRRRTYDWRSGIVTDHKLGTWREARRADLVNVLFDCLEASLDKAFEEVLES